jgi:hypothetical protein
MYVSPDSRLHLSFYGEIHGFFPALSTIVATKITIWLFNIAMENPNHTWRFSSLGKSSISMGHFPRGYKPTYNWWGFHPK